MTNVHLYPSTFFFVQDIFYVSSRAANGDGDEAAAIKIQTIRMAISAIFSTVGTKYTTLHGEKRPTRTAEKIYAIVDIMCIHLAFEELILF